MSASSLHFDILACIAEYLDARSLVEFSLCCRNFSQLIQFDLLWKRLCQADYYLTYNDPNQTYRELYRQTTLRMFGRRPCHHLSRLAPNQSFVDQSAWKLPLLNNTPEDWLSHVSCCQGIAVEKVFLCMHCHILCMCATFTSILYLNYISRSMRSTCKSPRKTRTLLVF